MKELKRWGSLLLVVCMIQTGQAAPVGGPLTLVTPAHGQAIYRNLLEHHWVPQTGLFASFPDTRDVRMAQQASTYDQAAMGLLALRLNDQDRAAGILQFFRRAWTANPHGLMNFYNADFGTGGIEKTVHVGPNAWMGLFAARFANQTDNADAASLSLDIGYWIANSVPHRHGAVAMSNADAPHAAPWTRIFSTENNISYYAFLSELLKSRHLDAAQRQLFTQERFSVENWLLNTALDRKMYRVRRGEIPAGIDAIAALDTVTWLISAVGCKRLAERGVDPVRLLTTAANAFEVSVDGQMGVDPADQREADLVYSQDHAAQNQAKRPAADRHRMIWYEGLGQYVLALTAAAQYLHAQGRDTEARAFSDKAKRLQAAFDDGALASVKHQAAYPYATPGLFFRDGWRTPEPAADGPASSLIAGVWRLFAGLDADPLSANHDSYAASVQIALPRDIQVVAHPAPIYYGTSDDMTQRAWEHLNAGRWDEAIRQAEATIQQWSGWAAKLQERKMRDSGALLAYNGEAKERQAIFNYWALNDVAACYFILGKSWDARHDYVLARRSFQQIADHYSLAQVWDPKGWFWSPLEAVNEEFIHRDPSHYAALD